MLCSSHLIRGNSLLRRNYLLRGSHLFDRSFLFYSWNKLSGSPLLGTRTLLRSLNCDLLRSGQVIRGGDLFCCLNSPDVVESDRVRLKLCPMQKIRASVRLQCLR